MQNVSNGTFDGKLSLVALTGQRTPFWKQYEGFRLMLVNKTGKQVATSAWKTKYNVNAATPVIIGNKIFISSGYQKGCSLLEFTGRKLKTVWTSKEMRNHMSGCVYFDGYLYGFDNSNLKCLDLEGVSKWKKGRLQKGSLTLADGKLIVLGGRGDLLVVAASPDGFEELSRARVLDRPGQLWTTPVLCGGLIYCRGSDGELVCIDRRAKKTAEQRR